MGLVSPGTEIDVSFKTVLFPLAGLVPPGTEIGVFFKIVLFNIVSFNVASTKSSNIAGILSFGGLLGLIRKRLVGFRLDFLAGFLQVSLAGFLQGWLTFLPSSCLCSRCARPCWFWFFGYRKWPPSVSLGPTAISYAGWAMYCTPLGRVMNDE